MTSKKNSPRPAHGHLYGTFGLVVAYTVLTTAMSTPARAATTAPTATVVRDASNTFTFDLYRRLAAGKKDGNLFCSPLSVHTAMGMVWAGARGDTAAELQKALGFRAGLDVAAPAWKLHLGALRTAGMKGGNTLTLANALFGEKKFRFEKGFLGLVQASFNGPLTPVSFREDPGAAVRLINGWASKETRGLIPTLISREMITPLTRLVLANAVYFKGTWARSFVKSATRDEDFHLAPGRKAKVPTMHLAHRLRHAATADLQAVELPYRGDQLSMVVLLPRPGLDVAKLEQTLTAESVDRVLAQLRSADVRLSLPRWKSTWEGRLNQTLTQQGIRKVFSESEADLSGIAKDRLFVSFVVHKAFVKVDEEGTEAAAVTGVGVSVTSVPPPPVVFRADRPFLYLIRDRVSGTVIFLGRLASPA
jgi:serpin B